METNTRKLPAIVKAYVVVMIVGALVVAVLYAVAPDLALLWWHFGGLWLSSAIVASLLGATFLELHPIPVPTTHLFDDSKNDLALSTSIYVAVLLLFGPSVAIVVGGLAILLADRLRHKPAYKLAFNASQYVVSMGVAGLFLPSPERNGYLLADLLSSPEGILDLVAALAVYFALNTAFVGAVIAMVDGTKLLDVWRHGIRQMLLEHASTLDIGLVAAILWMVNPVCLVLLALPMLVVYLSSRTTSLLKSETTRALVAVAEMVESRDPYSYRHSMEVARISAQVATRMGLSLDHVEMVKLAAQLHDIGKIGTPDQVLNKPGSLTDEEWVLMQKHPAEGAKVLQYFSLFRSGVDLVQYHQEHFDGSGYPVGLAGEQIPIGARIIHVADAYQAMTSDRVYRKAMDPAVAFERLVASAGKQFDPEAVKALAEVLRESGIRLNEVSL